MKEMTEKVFEELSLRLKSCLRKLRGSFAKVFGELTLMTQQHKQK